MNIADTLLHNLFGDHYTDENHNTWYWNDITGEYTVFPQQDIEGVTVTAPAKEKTSVVNIINGNLISKSKKVNIYLIVALIIAIAAIYYIIKIYKK